MKIAIDIESNEIADFIEKIQNQQAGISKINCYIDVNKMIEGISQLPQIISSVEICP